MPFCYCHRKVKHLDHVLIRRNTVRDRVADFEWLSLCASKCNYCSQPYRSYEYEDILQYLSWLRAPDYLGSILYQKWLEDREFSPIPPPRRLRRKMLNNPVVSSAVLELEMQSQSLNSSHNSARVSTRIESSPNTERYQHYPQRNAPVLHTELSEITKKKNKQTKTPSYDQVSKRENIRTKNRSPLSDLPVESAVLVKKTDNAEHVLSAYERRRRLASEGDEPTGDFHTAPDYDLVNNNTPYSRDSLNQCKVKTFESYELGEGQSKDDPDGSQIDNQISSRRKSDCDASFWRSIHSPNHVLKMRHYFADLDLNEADDEHLTNRNALGSNSSGSLASLYSRSDIRIKKWHPNWELKMKNHSVKDLKRFYETRTDSDNSDPQRIRSKIPVENRKFKSLSISAPSMSSSGHNKEFEANRSEYRQFKNSSDTVKKPMKSIIHVTVNNDRLETGSNFSNSNSVPVFVSKATVFSPNPTDYYRIPHEDFRHKTIYNFKPKEEVKAHYVKTTSTPNLSRGKELTPATNCSGDSDFVRPFSYLAGDSPISSGANSPHRVLNCNSDYFLQPIVKVSSQLERINQHVKTKEVARKNRTTGPSRIQMLKPDRKNLRSCLSQSSPSLSKFSGSSMKTFHGCSKEEFQDDLLSFSETFDDVLDCPYGLTPYQVETRMKEFKQKHSTNDSAKIRERKPDWVFIAKEWDKKRQDEDSARLAELETMIRESPRDFDFRWKERLYYDLARRQRKLPFPSELVRRTTDVELQLMNGEYHQGREGKYAIRHNAGDSDKEIQEKISAPCQSYKISSTSCFSKRTRRLSGSKKKPTSNEKVPSILVDCHASDGEAHV